MTASSAIFLTFIPVALVAIFVEDRTVRSLASFTACIVLICAVGEAAFRDDPKDTILGAISAVLWLRVAWRDNEKLRSDED